MSYGRFIDNKQSIAFDFEQRTLQGFAGDTISSALWRNGVQTISRSFKYHRRRGLLTLAGDDANVLLDVNDSPNANGDIVAISPNMRVRARHYWGSLENDRLSVLQRASRLLPPGFYYKAFFKPAGAWRLWEPVIRRLAGLGVVNTHSPHIPADKVNRHCDVAVIGGGPAGIGAASAAVAAGKRVILLDKNVQLGGSANWLPTISGVTDQLSLAIPDEVEVYTDCRATGIFPDNLILAVTQQSDIANSGLLRLSAKQIVIATGKRDLPCVFANNDLPGVMLTQAALRLAYLYDVVVGKRAVMLASSAIDVVAARALRDYGIDITAIFTLSSTTEEWAQILIADGFNVLAKPTDFSAVGQDVVRGVKATVNGQSISYDCHCVLMSNGRIAKIELPASAGLSFSYDDYLNDLLGSESDSIKLAGAINQRLEAATALADGQAAIQQTERPAIDASPSPGGDVLLSDTKTASRHKCFIDFDEDLQPRDLEEGIADGFADSQLLKRYTTAGMGPGQGKLGNLLVKRKLAAVLDVPTASLGSVTSRPPAAAETIGQLAGYPMHPVKWSALHLQHTRLSARMMTAGEWLRPLVYTDSEQESLSMRSQAGMIDVSTLGKIRIRGTDAAELLGRLYTGGYHSQQVGAIRYALMLDESGVIVDDGVAAKLEEDCFWVTTTTGNANAVYRGMLLWKSRWGLNAEVINMTSAYGAVNVAGPQSTTILSTLFPETDWNMNYMRVIQTSLGGASAIIMRIGFVGEKGYEIHLPYGYLPALWTLLETVKQPCLVTPCGVETQRLLRLEKGHIIVGQDTDGLTTPQEADMSWAISKKKSFFIGKRALDIHAQKTAQQKLVGFTAEASWKNRLNECDLILHQGEIAGRVTSVSYSPTLKTVIGLAYAPASVQCGDSLSLRTAAGLSIQVQVTKIPFYDPTGECQK